MLQSFKDEVDKEQENLSDERRSLFPEKMQPSTFPPNWKVLKIGDLGQVKGGGTPSTTVSEYWGNDIPWLTPGEISRVNSIFISTTERKITNAGLVNSSLEVLPIGTVLMTSRATIGEVAINTVPMTTNQGFINIICDAERVNNLFLAYWIKYNKEILDARGSGATFRELSKSNFKTISIVLPSLPEQRAIAHVLQTVQQAIQTRRKELELERERKAALMQHLFTHGTRNEPTKQSEVGEIPESWEIRKLGEVLQNAQYGISLAGKLSGTYPILRMNNLIDGVISYDNLQYVDIDKRTLALFQLNRGDILFNRTNSADLVGKTALFDEDNPTVFASYLIRITTDKERLLPDFLNWYFNWQVIQKRLQSIATRGVSQANISASNLQNFKILIPPLLTEQEEIAKIFNLHTAKIAILEKEITLHEELFRALLDELMTGRISTLPLVEQLEKGTSSDGQRTPDGTGTID